VRKRQSVFYLRITTLNFTPNTKINGLDCKVNDGGLKTTGIPENSKMTKIKPVAGNMQT